MEDEKLQMLKDFSDLRILHALAFEQANYDPEPIKILRSLLKERQLSDQDVLDYRKVAFSLSELEIRCDSCGEELTLDEKDLIQGRYVCPMCKKDSIVEYPQIEYYPDYLLEEDKSTTTEPIDAKKEVESAVITSKSNDDTQTDLAETPCHRCQKPVNSRDIYVLAGGLYCEKCYNEELKSGRKVGKKKTPEPVVYKGFGGWLIFLAGQIAFEPILIAVALLFTDYYDHPGDQFVSWTTIIVSAILIYLLIRLKKRFRIFFILYNVVVVILLMLVAYLNSDISTDIWPQNTLRWQFGIDITQMNMTSGAIAIRLLIQNIIWSIIWIWYLFRSERVKQTMIR